MSKGTHIHFVSKIKGSAPFHAHEGDAGVDLCSTESVYLEPHRRTLIKTGLYVELPKGTELQIRPRSGLAIEHGITVLNAPGTIDSNYRGEIKVPIINLGYQGFQIEIGMKICQAVLADYIKQHWVAIEHLTQTERGVDGFGSTGL